MRHCSFVVNIERKTATAYTNVSGNCDFMKKGMIKRNVSLTLGIVSFLALIYVDKEIANQYNHADGKTKAMFGIMVLLRFNYRYLILVPAIMSMLLSAMTIWRKQFTFWDLVALVLGLVSIVGIVTSSWRLMV
jgi:hypothetical protein